MSTLVLTSLNPFANVAYQLDCFNMWAKKGYEIKSHNTDFECQALLKHGVDSDRIIRIEDEDSGQQLFDKPIPRIAPLLENALKTDHDYFLLTNSDIFPAHRKVISECLSKSFEFAAFTRTDSLDISLIEFHSQSYYRGGLDLFWFKKTGLQQVVAELNKSKVSERMTFGIPGWDYFLGHVISKKLNGPILDGGIFIHQSHRNTYSRLDEVEHYATEMINSGMYAARDTEALIHEFMTFITRMCDEQRRTSEVLKLTFFEKPSAHNTKDVKTQREGSVVLEQFFSCLQEVGVHHSFSDIELAIFLQKQLEDCNWATASSLIKKQNNHHSYWFYCLQLLLLSLLCNQQDSTKKLTLKYPHGNLHGLALRQILQNESGLKQEQYIFDLFASEMVNYGLVNRNLLKYLFTTTTNSDERALFLSVINVCKKGLSNAYAPKSTQ